MSENSQNPSSASSPQEAASASPATDSIQFEIPETAPAFARLLYNKLKGCLDREKYMEAFNVLLQLLKENKEDSIARKLLRPIGQYVYKDEAKELSQALSSNHQDRINTHVWRLRMMADESTLAKLPGFRTAVSKVEEAARNRAYAMLLGAISKLKDTQHISDREKMALSIEKFVTEQKLQLTSEQQSLIASVHQAWQKFCRHEELMRKYREQADGYEVFKKRVEDKFDLPHCCDQLKASLEVLTELAELKEAEELRVSVAATLKKAQSIVFAQNRRKLLLRSFTGILIVTAIFVVVMMTYAFTSAGTREHALQDAREAKNIKLVREHLNSIEPLRGLRTALSPAYAREMSTCQAWLKAHQETCAQVKEMEVQLKAAVDALGRNDVTPAEMTSGLIVAESASKLCDTLDREFNCREGEKLLELINVFKSSMADIRPTVLSRFTEPSPQLDLPGLDALYKEYLGCRDLLKVTYEEHEDIRRAFTASVSAELSRLSAAAPTPQEAAAIVSKFDQYNSSMKLDASLRESLADYSTRFALFNELPQKLMTVSNMNEYVEAVKACGDCYARVPNAIMVNELEAMIGKEDAAMRSFKLQEFFKSLPEGMTQESVLEYLQKLRSVYVDGAPLYQVTEKNKQAEKLITDLTTDSKRFWRDNLVRTVGYGPYVYVGTLAGERKVRHYDVKGTPIKRLAEPKTKNTPITEVALKNSRSSMGYVPDKLKAGTVTPAQLLMNVARFNDEKCPVFARAYLFYTTLQLIEELDEMASGVAFSPSLRQDLASFKKLPQYKNKQYGCWMLSHKENTETPYINFFNQIASHDYLSEILGSILPITDAVSTYAGFIDAEGKAIRIQAGDAPLYIMRNGVISLYKDTKEAPYTPLFTLSVPQPQPAQL